MGIKRNRLDLLASPLGSAQLNAFYKICERHTQFTTHNSLNPFVDKYLSDFISANRKAYSVNDVLIRFIENWKQSLDNHKQVGFVKPIVY